MITTNMQRLGGSTSPEPGDVFGMYYPARGWVFGRVIRTDASGSGAGRGTGEIMDEVLIYIYNTVQAASEPIPNLPRSALLIPPKIIDRMPWKRGYLKTLRQGPLAASDVYARHCFEFGSYYWDEFRTPVPKRTEPCGVAGLGNLGTLDDDVSLALGIPPIPPGGDLGHVDLDDLNHEPGGVTVHISASNVERAALNRIEAKLVKCAAGIARCLGHGFHLAPEKFDIQFETQDVKKLVSVLATSMRSGRSQKLMGWHITVASVADADFRIVNL